MNKKIDKVFTELILFLINHDPVFESIQSKYYIKLTLQNMMWKCPTRAE